MDGYQAVLIAGPTASGKSQLALDIARLTGGVIVNADSMQVYRDLRILTARPSEADVEQADHELYGFLPGDDAYSVGRYAEDVRDVLQRLENGGRLPIIVGGTGLYFRALLSGLSPIPPVPDEIRAYWRATAASCDAATLHGQLAARDPIMADRLVPSDRQRVVRALEVYEATGRSLAYWQSQPGTPVLDEARTVRLVMDVPRHELYARCDRRLLAMVEQGVVDEVEALLAQGLDDELPLMRAVGVAAFASHLAGGAAIDDAITRAQAETRNYVKRQLTWLRRNMITWKAVTLKYNDNELQNSLRI
ncbi:MAG: tRNA (adenosine(37)-N6)-dimethylallyltransferase MiaA [Hyphomicrobiaceae bacterium]|nr:tRNA (adenosine(37)-N6)-dimethylallyltransferase MiaA [Hyphomicrobiaceae bacterium]